MTCSQLRNSTHRSWGKNPYRSSSEPTGNNPCSGLQSSERENSLSLDLSLYIYLYVTSWQREGISEPGAQTRSRTKRWIKKKSHTWLHEVSHTHNHTQQLTLNLIVGWINCLLLQSDYSLMTVIYNKNNNNSCVIKNKKCSLIDTRQI